MGLFRHERAEFKRYVDEIGRREVLQLLRRHDCVTSAVLPIELRSALRRRVSEGTVDSARMPEILERVAADRAYWTLDAIHIASAQLFRARVTAPELIFVSADARQTEVAAAVGMTIRHIGS